MKLSIFIIATLLVLSQAVNLRKQEDLGQLFLSLSQQDKTDLLASFPMLAQMTGPLNDVQDFINDLELQVMAEQREANTLYATESARCDGEIAKRADNLAAGQKALAYEQNRRAMCQTAWTNAEATMVNLVEYAEALVSQRNTAVVLRNLQQSAFEKLDDDFNNFIGTIDGAQYYIQVMGYIPEVVDEMNSGLFLETNANSDAHLGLKESAFAIVKSAITHGMLSHTSNVIGKVSMFLRMNQNVVGAQEGETRGVDTAMLETLWMMFEDLRTTAQQEQNQNYQQEVLDIETFTALIEVIDANEAHNNAEIVSCQELIDTSSACVAQATTFVEDLDGVEGVSEGRLDRQERIMIKANAMCDAFDAEYESTTEVRKNQINLLKALRTELFIRLDNVYGSARTRSEQEQEEWEDLSL